MTQREKIAREFSRVVFGQVVQDDYDYAAADYILAERAKREEPLVEALRAIESCCQRYVSGGALRTILLHQASRALADHAALDAPPKRTLREECEALRAVAKERGVEFLDIQEAMNRVFDALEREDAK